MAKRRGPEEKRRWRRQDELSSFYNRKAKRLDKRRRKTMKRNRKRWGSWRTSIAGKTFLPAQPPMGALCSGGDGWRMFLLVRHRLSIAKGNQNGLCLQQLHPLSPDLAALPISPEHGRRRGIAGRRIANRRIADQCISFRRRGSARPEHRAHASW